MILYHVLILFLPVIFIIYRKEKDIAAVTFLIALFLYFHSLFISGRQAVSWDTQTWSLGLYYVKEVLQSGYLPGWNPYLNSGEPLYIYHYLYTFWPWFLFVLLDSTLSVEPVVLFNLFFVFSFIFYNIGCYLFFQKIFNDRRVILFCFATSLYAISFVMYFQEPASFCISIYFPYLLYFFLEYIEKRNIFSLVIIGGLLGIVGNSYVPHFCVSVFIIFILSYLAFMGKGYYFLNLNKKTIALALGGLILMLISISPVLYVIHQVQDFVSPVRSVSGNVSGPLNPAVTVAIGFAHNQEYKAIWDFINISSYNHHRGILFISILPLILAAIGVIKSKNRFYLTILAATIITFFVSLGTNSFLKTLIGYLPTFAAMRHYVLFEIFVQLFIICLAGMGLEYILSLQDSPQEKPSPFFAVRPFVVRLSTSRFILLMQNPLQKQCLYRLTGLKCILQSPEKRTLLVLLLSISAVIVLAYAMLEFQLSEYQIIPTIMYMSFFFLSILAIYLLILYKTDSSYYFLLAILILSLLSYQSYLGYYKFDSIMKESKDFTELERLEAILEDSSPVSWNPQREIYDKTKMQTLTVNCYPTFETVLRRHELAFWEPVERNILIKKSYYELYPPFRDKCWAYFGVANPKIFATNGFEVVPGKAVVEEMENSYYNQGYPEPVIRASYRVTEEIETNYYSQPWIRKVYLLEEDASELMRRETHACDNQVPILVLPEVIQYELNYLKLIVDPPGGAFFLVYLQNYDKNWHAYINGQETKIYKAYGSFQAVCLKEGKNIVEFRFESPYKYYLVIYFLGVTLTLTSMVAFFYNKETE